MSSAEARLLEAKVQHVAEQVTRSNVALEDVSRKLEPLPALVTSMEWIRQDLARGTATMVDHDARLKRIEQDMPGLKELRRWVIAGVLAGVGMLGAALLKLVILDLPRIPTTIVPSTPAVVAAKDE